MTSRHQTSADPDTFKVARIQYRLATREMDQVSELNSVLLEFPFAGQFSFFCAIRNWGQMDFLLDFMYLIKHTFPRSQEGKSQQQQNPKKALGQ